MSVLHPSESSQSHSSTFPDSNLALSRNDDSRFDSPDNLSLRKIPRKTFSLEQIQKSINPEESQLLDKVESLIREKTALEQELKKKEKLLEAQKTMLSVLRTQYVIFIRIKFIVCLADR